MATFQAQRGSQTRTPPKAPTAAPAQAAKSVVSMPEPDHYVATEAFSIPYNGGLLNYSVGDVITSSYLVKYMLKEKAPIALSEEVGEPICCPHCQKAFFPTKS